jgi:nucleoside-diphosphate-sugar epimerase
VRPSSKKERQRLNDDDSYGDGKLQVEESLQRAFHEHQFPYTALRLPDVYGPFDSTRRFWRYYLWVLVSRKVPIDLSKLGASRKLSFVFRDDVIAAIYAILEAGAKTYGEAFNIAHVLSSESKSERTTKKKHTHTHTHFFLCFDFF